MQKKKDIQLYIDQLSAVGWFDVIEDKEKYIDSMKRLFDESGGRKFHHALPWVYYDAECVYDEGEYANLLKELSEDSFGLFGPKLIDEKWSGTGVGSDIKVSVVTAQGEELVATYKYKSDHLDERFYLFIEKAVQACDSRCTVYNKVGGQDGQLLIGGSDALKKARKKRLFTK